MRLALLLPLLAACSPTLLAPTAAEDHVGARFPEGSTESDLVLRVANEASFQELDIDAALDVRAAQGIVDGRPFTTLAALDAVPYVGVSALDKMYDYALETYGDPNDLVLYAANTLSLTELDVDVALDVRAAEGIVEHRPFATLADLDAVPWVGGSALQKLEDYAVDRWGVVPDCPEGSILASTGATYTDLEEAVTRSPSGTTLTLCSGTFAATDAHVDMDLVLVGQGREHTRITTSDGWPALNVVGANVSFHDLSIAEANTWDGVVVAEFGAVIELNGVDCVDNTGGCLYVSRSEAHLTGGTVVAGNDGIGAYVYYSTLDSDGTLWSGARDGVAVEIQESSASFVGDAFYDNDGEDGAVLVQLPSTSHPYTVAFEDVDFGIGATDNGSHDVVYETLYTGTRNTWDHLTAGTDGSCGWANCWF